MKNSFKAVNRSQSLNSIKYVRNNVLQTLAQKNMVSLRQSHQKYHPNHPLRILLPDFFNIPKFIDKQIDFQGIEGQKTEWNNIVSSFKIEKGLKKKLKDLTILAEGMKRAKNIRQESRYYFIEGVILHNSGAFEKSIEMFEKFLKIVLFIRDDKSIELALNSIALGFMYLNRPQEALQYHEKQISLSQNSQTFIGKINIAMCYEMMKNKSVAHEIYEEILQMQTNQKDRKIDFLYQLLQRTKPQQAQNYFLTQNHKNKSVFAPQHIESVNNRSILKQSPNVHINRINKSRSPQKQKEQQSFLNSSFMQKRYQNAKVNFAIFNAEEHLNGYLKELKSSFTVDH